MVIARKHPRFPMVGPARGLLSGAIAIAGLYLLLDAKPVVDVLFSFGDEPVEYYDPHGFPLGLDRVVSLSEWRALPLPAGVLQPSGLGVFGDEVLISTDMSSVHLGRVTPEASNVQEQDTTWLRGGPLALRQGYLEAASFGRSADELFVVGGNDQLFRLFRTDDAITLNARWRLEPQKGATAVPEVAGLAYRGGTDTLFAAFSPNDGQGVAISEYATDGKYLRRLNLHSPVHDAAVLGLLLNEANVAGMTVVGDQLVVLSDRSSVLLWFDIDTGRLTRVWGLEGLPTLSGIAHGDGKLFLAQDHEYYQETPPLRVLELAAHHD
ncbi:hypothetical protein Q4577_04365 [Marinovum sp. 2_MG-2023]|uniref:hypothetical protein n=1 Tax=unclassified Marinovum TaxID=2647166 RepID=UPI0026E40483|nr:MULTISPECIES: hypothetical protein [unclassified Marinovum]MDO6729240.1 hypothetical protein [Marinovum sp. 2_MG-2023]MDO6779133.1 hypothetical protein [Marinovum sp. 1_MG-2023]